MVRNGLREVARQGARDHGGVPGGDVQRLRVGRGVAGHRQLDGLRGGVVLGDAGGAAQGVDRNLEFEDVETRRRNQDVDVGWPNCPDHGIEDPLAVV